MKGLGLLNNETIRNIVYQVIAVVGVGALIGYLTINLLNNLEQRKIATGFDFLEDQASFAISESVIDYSPTDSYGRAFLVGLLNTLRVAFIGIILATILGTFIGLLRFSRNWFLSKLALVYIDVIRNIPLLLQLFFWYAVLTVSLPSPRQALTLLPNTFLSNRGLFFPIPEAHPAWSAMGIAFIGGVILTCLLGYGVKKRQQKTGKRFPLLLSSLGLLFGLPVMTYFFYGAPTALDIPTLQRFNFRGGMTLTPEMTALLFCLVLYTAAFIAEIVRSGILGVPKGQFETGLSLGLTHGQVMSLIMIPQALRIIVPPMTNQYLNLTKNSSLAVAIGYPELVNVLNTIGNQTGQAVETIALMMGVYLSISLGISLFMNWYNARIAIKER